MKYYEGVIGNTEFFTTAQLAEKLKMNVQVITRKVQSGEITAYKIGKDWRIPEQSVYEWLEERSNRNGKPPSGKVAHRKNTETPTKPAPIKHSDRKYLLEYILAQFEPNRLYDEDEVNRLISRYDNDFAAVRDEFLSEKMMKREQGGFRRCSGYRLSG